jgi:protein-L-isoaspartate O-methyltransferase
VNVKEGQSVNATYSPDDNKLRLYSAGRLDQETYARVKAAGFSYAPKQGLFVAPAWSPERVDLLIELCGEIGDEDTSLVERAEERAERFGDYSERRAQDASAAREGVQAIGQRFEFGQPILIGHHSERKARKDAERMESGMRRAVKMWDTATYWTRRAAGALASAKYKERSDVRARRIKGIEADKRKQEKNIAEAKRALALWSLPTLTREQALLVANMSYSSRRYPLSEFPRQLPASQYEGEMGVWSAIEGGVISVEQAQAHCVDSYARSIERMTRWLDHYENRLAYERAMLEEQGGLAADRFTLEIGGQVLVGREWVVVTRINKSGGRICSLTTARRYSRVVGIEEVTDYRAPSDSDTAKVKAVTKLAPLVNYQGEGFVTITQAQWDKIPKDYRGTRTIDATPENGRHRVRRALGVYVLGAEKDFNLRHSYPSLFISDAKHTRPPQGEPGEASPEALPLPVREVSTEPLARTQATPNAEAVAFDKLRESLKAGVQVVSAPQLFPTPPELAARLVELAEVRAGARVLEPSAGTGRLVAAVRAAGESVQVVAVEVNQALSEVLRRSFAHAESKMPQGVEVITRDFLELAAGDIGVFDAVIMNPPFAGGADVRHITHALTMLKPGGRLVAVCADGPRQNAVLRPLVAARGGEWETLPPGTFKDEGTGVNTVLLSMTA